MQAKYSLFALFEGGFFLGRHVVLFGEPFDPRPSLT